MLYALPLGTCYHIRMNFVNKEAFHKVKRYAIELWSNQHATRPVFLAVFLFVSAAAAFHILFVGRIYPGVRAAGVNLGGKTAAQAGKLLSSSVISPQTISLVKDGQEFSISLEELGFEYNIQETVKRAGSVARDKSLSTNFKDRWEILHRGRDVALVFSLNESLLDERVATISSQVSVPALEPSVAIQQGKVEVNPGKNGEEVNLRLLKQRVFEALSFPSGERNIRLELPVRELTPQLSEEQVELLRKLAEKMLGKSLILKFEFESFTYPAEQLVGLLNPGGGFDKIKISLLAADVAKGVNRDPQNAVFEFKDGKVQEFRPAKSGVRVLEDELTEKIASELRRFLEEEVRSISIQIPVVSTQPEITTEEVNNLGIKELLGRGSSRFRGSIAGRIHNIGLSSSRIHGALIAPGEVFSFNERLGDVSVYTGYQQAYIIKDGRTILGDGGGVCQVSTTFFRAALDAGLPIAERHQHSYRVSYYEQDSRAGIDATIYVPSVDLKVKNDTSGHLLVQRIFNPKSSTLIFEIYGTDDGREVTISTPRVWDIKPPPPPLYQDDPTLPAGTVKQVDFAASGAKAAFDYKVVRNGEVLQDRTFYSNFRPWQAVYLRGTGPAQ